MPRQVVTQHYRPSCLLAVVAVVVLGCGAPDVTSVEELGEEIAALGGEIPEEGERFAVLTATWVRGQPGTVRRTDPLGVRGLFVSHGGSEREGVLRELGVPRFMRLQPIDTCVVDHTTTGRSLAEGLSVGDGGDRWVDLLDAGEVGLETGGAKHPLDCQYFPDVVPDVSGVTYAGTAELSRWVMRGRERPVLRFVGSGSGEVGPFSVERAMPAPLRLYAVDGHRAHQGYVTVESEGDIEVRWDRRGASEEPVLLSLSRRSFGAVDTVRCVVADDGEFTIPGTLRGELPEHPEPSTDRLTARRAAGAEFYARGLDEGWAFFITEDFVLLR